MLFGNCIKKENKTKNPVGVGTALWEGEGFYRFRGRPSHHLPPRPSKLSMGFHVCCCLCSGAALVPATLR